MVGALLALVTTWLVHLRQVHPLRTAPTKQTAFQRGCSCLSCTNKAIRGSPLDWCTFYLVGAVETTAPPKAPLQKAMARAIAF